MFKSSGLFKDVSCPFFLFGLCERPFCHFKHSRHEEAKARKEREEKEASLKTEEDVYVLPTSTLQTKLDSIEKSIKSEKTKISNGNKEARGKPTTVVQTKPTGTPLYSPTPINELQQQKVQGRLGCSKYDLALLEGPSSVGEYDPASNFNYSTTTNGSTPDSVPDYAKELHPSGNLDESNEDDNSLAKIPNFVSVDYTPTVEAECSDEESFHEKKDWFSDEGSEQSRDSVAEVEASEASDKKKVKEEGVLTSVLPFEFTEDGHVKVVPLKDDSLKKTVKTPKKEQDKSIIPEKKSENIFSLFKDEFDKDLEDAPKSNSSDSKDTKASSKSDKHSSSTKEKHRKSSTKEDTAHSHKHKDTSKSPHKQSSHSHSNKHTDKDRHGKGKVSSSHDKSSKHSSSSHKHESKSNKHKSSSEYSHSKSSKHDNQSSSKERNPSGSSHKSSSHRSSSQSNKSASGKDNKELNNKSEKRRSQEHQEKKSNTKPSSFKRKKIVDLDFDIFGGLDDGEPKEKRAHYEDDMSDLEKYFSDEDPFDECLKIFNEANKASSSTSEHKRAKKSADSDSIPPPTTGKKRTALKQSDPVKRQKALENKPKPKPSPAQVMMNRYKMMQAKILAAEEEAKEKRKAKVREMSAKNMAAVSPSPSSTRPNIAGASAAFSQYMSSKTKKTTAITVTKGAKRKAHTPTVPIAKLKRPVVEISTNSKVATNVRQRYLNMFIDECLKMSSSEQEAFDRGKEEEKAIFNRCSNSKIYLNLCVHTVRKLREEFTQKEEDKKRSKDSAKVRKVNGTKVSHSEILDGPGAKKKTFTVQRSGGAVKLREEDFTGVELYKRLQPYILTDDQLRANNFPRVHPEQGGAAMLYGEESTKTQGSIKGYEKLCVRCGKVFEVYPNGKYPVREECLYHWGKAWKKKVAGTMDTRYTCCQGDLASEGCQVARAHVHETNKKDTMSGYMKTIPCSPPIDGDYGVYALDCEMVYTTMGVELARVTVCGTDQEPVYESYVKPDNTIVDYNTRFSGITQEDLEDVTTSLREVQAVLLSLFSDKTILLGHSLESDLQALKLIHSTVVDTSVVFPHKLGPPFKRALRNLMIDYLKKIIQDDVAGHDSQEDALACLQLMQYRLKEDERKEARRLSS